MARLGQRSCCGFYGLELAIVYAEVGRGSLPVRVSGLCGWLVQQEQQGRVGHRGRQGRHEVFLDLVQGEDLAMGSGKIARPWSLNCFAVRDVGHQLKVDRNRSMRSLRLF